MTTQRSDKKKQFLVRNSDFGFRELTGQHVEQLGQHVAPENYFLRLIVEYNLTLRRIHISRCPFRMPNARGDPVAGVRGNVTAVVDGIAVKGLH